MSQCLNGHWPHIGRWALAYVAAPHGLMAAVSVMLRCYKNDLFIADEKQVNYLKLFENAFILFHRRLHDEWLVNH